MAHQLWLLRHAEAEPHGARADFERELTERGREQAIAAGRALRALEVVIHELYTSPRVRALQTAELCAASLDVEPIAHQPLSSGFDREDALALLSGPERRVLIVGHEPDFSQVVHDLTGARVDFKKGAIAAIRLDGSRGELIALLRPRELECLSQLEAD